MLRTAGFFALRTPLLPATVWPIDGDRPAPPGEERRSTPAARSLVADPVVREAIFVASPDLDASIDAWLANPVSEASERSERAEHAVARYLARMAWRPTPFGLFAGITVGRIGDRTRITLSARAEYRRHTRLDGGFLDALTQALALRPELRGELRYRPNTSLYTAAGRMRYVETRIGDDYDASTDGKKQRSRELGRSYSLSDVADTSHLRTALARARDGATLEEIAESVVAAAPGVAQSAAARYVADLIDNQLLVAILPLPITGPEPIEPLADTLRATPGTQDIAECLATAQRNLATLDRDGVGLPRSRYIDIASSLASLPIPAEPGRLFQVDLHKPAVEATLGANVVAEITRAVELLHRVNRAQPDRLARFRQRFTERYEGRRVPLPLALDDESGIGVDATTDPEPLLRGIPLDDAPIPEVSWGAREDWLLTRLSTALANGEREILLSSDDVDALAATVGTTPPLPHSISAMASIAARSAAAIDGGEFRVHVGGASGVSGMELLGRFCHGDEALSRAVRDHLRSEETLDDDAIFAEIVHSPAGRVGNILLRPTVRDHDIVFLGDSGTPRDRQIEVRDLLVGVEAERIVLRRVADGRRVIPRLTTAHNWQHFRNLATYRFLCMLQAQGVSAAIAWDWGPLVSAPFLPRVRSGRVVLTLARWRARAAELKTFRSLDGAALIQAVHRWRVERRAPRVVTLVEADNVLPVDLDSRFGADALMRASHDGQSDVTLQEMLAGPGELWVEGPEGMFAHEITVPLISQSTREARTTPVAAASPAATMLRRFAPGTEWLYAKVYTGPATLDRVLRRAVGPLVRRARAAGWIDRWFFIRYGDPDWHLRVRFHGEPSVLCERLLPALRDVMTPLLGDDTAWRMELGTYEREVERYGGPVAIELAEELFEADSDAVLAMIEQPGTLSRDDRWRVALCGIDRLFDDLGIDAAGRRALSAQLRDSYVAEHRAPAGLRRQLGERFRRERRALEALLTGDGSRGSSDAHRAALQARSGRMAPIVARLKALEAAGQLTTPIEQIASSMGHMFANRVLRFGARDQELVMYDFLSRLYEGRAARDRVAAGPGAPSVSTDAKQPGLDVKRRV